MKQVRDFIKEHRMIEEGDRVIAGISGGADSVCLFFELLDYQQECSYIFEVVHIEHGIRGTESLEDAAFVERLCREHHIPFHLVQKDVSALAKEQRMSVEEMGRKVRYDAFGEICRERKANKIAVAHNLDDQAETILMNLVRGSGIKGLGGILPVREQVIRPLLNTSRAQIEQELQKRRISWRTDATNLETEYTRNRMRIEILPQLSELINARAVQNIAAAGRHMQRAEDFLERQAQTQAEHMVTAEKGSVKIRRQEFAKQESLMQEYIMRDCLKQMGGQKDVGMVHIRALCALAGMENGKSLDLPGGRCARNKNEFLVLEKKSDVLLKGLCEEAKKMEELVIPGTICWGDYRITAALEEACNQRIPEKKYTKWFDYDTIKNRLCVRTRRTGDYLAVNSAGGSKKLKNYLIEEKVLREERDQLPLLADGSHIIWVVGHRISEACKVNGHTKHILKIQIEDRCFTGSSHISE